MGIMGNVQLRSLARLIGNVDGAPFEPRRRVTFLYTPTHTIELSAVKADNGATIEEVRIEPWFHSGPVDAERWESAEGVILKVHDVLSVDVSNSDGSAPLGFFLEPFTP